MIFIAAYLKLSLTSRAGFLVILCYSPPLKGQYSPSCFLHQGRSLPNNCNRYRRSTPTCPVGREAEKMIRSSSKRRENNVKLTNGERALALRHCQIGLPPR